MQFCICEIVCWCVRGRGLSERVCSFSNPSDLPSRGNVRQALVDYFLEDRGMIQGSDDLVDLVLQLTDEPYQVASTTSGAKT